MNATPQTTVNAAGNLVTVNYSNHITAADMREHSTQVDALGPKVKPGFVLLTDLTKLERMDDDCAPLLSHVMEQFNRFGAARIIRVIPDPKKDPGLGILTRFHYKRGMPVNVVTTMAEAQRLL